MTINQNSESSGRKTSVPEFCPRASQISDVLPIEISISWEGLEHFHVEQWFRNSKSIHLPGSDKSYR